MAVGDIKQFGLWRLSYTSQFGSSYRYASFKDVYTEIDYEATYPSIVDSSKGTDGEGSIQWIEFNIDGRKAYLSKDVVFNYITSENILEDDLFTKTHTIDGEKYKFTFLTPSQYVSIPSSVISKISVPSTRYILANKCINSPYWSVVYKVGDRIVDHDEVADASSAVIYNLYLPVLIPENIPPVISGADKDLGDKNIPFNVTYSVSDADDGQELTVNEKLNNTTIKTLQNPIQGSTLTCSITDELFASLSVGTTNTIEIEATDGSATSYRRYTFVKTNSAPLINYTGQSDLGELTSKPSITYSVSDNEGDTITVTEKLNGEVIKQFTATSNINYTITITDEFWLTCGQNTNTIEIAASDVNGGTSYKYITFTRQVNKVQITTKNPIETDAAATKIMVSPDWDKTGCTGKVEVCNNGFDASPTWEDMTTMAALNRPYVFTNKTKTAAKWGIKIRLTLTKNEGYTGEVAIYGFGGAYE